VYIIHRNVSVTYRTRYCSKSLVICGSPTYVVWREYARLGVCWHMTVGYGHEFLCGQTSTGFLFITLTRWSHSLVQGLVQRCDISNCLPISSRLQSYMNWPTGLLYTQMRHYRPTLCSKNSSRPTPNSWRLLCQFLSFTAGKSGKRTKFSTKAI